MEKENQNAEILRMIFDQNQTIISSLILMNQYQADILKRLQAISEKQTLIEVHLYKLQRNTAKEKKSVKVQHD